MIETVVAVSRLWVSGWRGVRRVVRASRSRLSQAEGWGSAATGLASRDRRRRFPTCAAITRHGQAW